MTGTGERPAIVIGAGWAGLACADVLQRAGRPVTVLDAAPAPGGRARNATIRLAGRELTADNGQHLLIGAYRHSLALLDTLGQASCLHRMPMQMQGAGLKLTRRGPGRAGLAIGFLTGSGLRWPDRLALVRLGAVLAMRRWQWPRGKTVAQLLQAAGQTDHLVQRVWRPLCVGALNTEPAQACAQTFVHVLHDALVQGPDSADYLVSKVPLGDLLAKPLWESLRRRGVRCDAATRVTGLRQADEPTHDAAQRTGSADNPADRPSARFSRWLVQTPHAQLAGADIVLATPWHSAARLLADHAPEPAAALQAMPGEAISTVYLAWPADVADRLPRVCMLDDNPSHGNFGQWLFRREATDNSQDLAIAAVVISASGALNRSNRELAAGTATQVCEQLGLPAPLDSLCISEKRATFLCTPNRPLVDARSVNGQVLPAGLYLAGDYCVARYPATLESAVISGGECARQLLAASSAP